MDWQLLIDSLGGGPMAMALVGLGFLYWRSLKRIDDLTDRYIDLATTTSDAMNNLSAKIESGMGGR